MTSKFEMKITLEVDFDDYENDTKEVKTSFIEEIFRRSLNKEIHNAILETDELMFWALDRFKNLTTLDEIKKVDDLGDMRLKVTRFEECEEEEDQNMILNDQIEDASEVIEK